MLGELLDEWLDEKLLDLESHCSDTEPDVWPAREVLADMQDVILNFASLEAGRL